MDFKLLFLILCIKFVVSSNIDCKYEEYSYRAVGTKYCCIVISNLIIDTPNQVQIETIKGNHLSGKSNDDEVYFHIESKPIQYLPRGLEKFYKNLRGIVIRYSQLKEIHQEDLKNYPKLSSLDLIKNNIEIIEDNLFDYNPDMEMIVFQDMKIFHVSSTVFDSLSKLTTLYLSGNPCTREYSKQDRTKTLKVISSVKGSCISSEFTSLDKKFENLDQISKNLNFANSQIFAQNLINLQTEFRASKFANFSPLKQKLQKLIDLKIKSPYEDVISNLSGVLSGFVTATNSYSSMDDKLSNLKIQQDNQFSEINHKLANLKLKIEQDLGDSQQNMLKAMDSKIEELEIRMTKKIEDILDEKLEKFMVNIRKIITML